MSKEEKITITKADLWRLVSLGIFIVLVISVFTGGFGYGNNDFNADSNNQGQLTNRPTNANAKVSADDDAFEGDENAPITLIEFSDYECPFCARFYSQTLNQIRENYIDTGKVKLVYRDFPLSFHPNAHKAAEAAECAGEQGKYFEMHDMLFENGVSGGVSSFKTYANSIGLNQAEFDSCLDNDDMASEVKKDFADGQAAGVTGTPGFFINGKLITGAQPYSVFEAAFEQELNA